jgi:hypothetical protein
MPTLPVVVTNMAVQPQFSVFENAVQIWTFPVLNVYKDVKYINLTHFGAIFHQPK